MSPLRQYYEAVLAEPPPETPDAPYEGPVPPDWMRAPEMVIGPYGQPHKWVDTALMTAWESKRGKALYELRKEGMRDLLRERGKVRESPEEARLAPDMRLRDLAYLNHPANLRTVQERQARGLTRSWNRPALPKRAEELPEAEMTWAPWWFCD
ncbi:hypothetical protein [Streptomyces sp. NPDC048340]|uniref:hypothetical protein n=1 Tax=Streptomyces sp. NPDC048340 TaxID=3365537 RepID=UPI003721EC77